MLLCWNFAGVEPEQNFSRAFEEKPASADLSGAQPYLIQISPLWVDGFLASKKLRNAKHLERTIARIRAIFVPPNEPACFGCSRGRAARIRLQERRVRRIQV